MKYELALQLKDADFPNLGGGIGERYIYPEPGYLGLSRSQACYDPTLSELIEECGERDITMEKYKHVNGSWVFTAEISGKKTQGSSFEEAVSKLWLAINKK